MTTRGHLLFIFGQLLLIRVLQRCVRAFPGVAYNLFNRFQTIRTPAFLVVDHMTLHPISEPYRESPNLDDPANGHGEGRDRILKKRLLTPRRIGLSVALLIFLAFLGYNLSNTTGGRRLNVDREKLTISTVERAAFQEFISVTGNVLPRTTVYLDAVQGGRVEEVFVREGELVNRDQPILRLSNSNVQLQLLSNEAGLAEQVSNLENMRFQIEQSRLNLRQQLVQMDYEIQRLERQHERSSVLVEKKVISDEEHDQVVDELDYWKRRRALTIQAHRQDSLAQNVRMTSMEDAVDRMRRNFSILQETLDNLIVRAPVAGHLTMLDAEVGELRVQGTRFGQIDVLDEGYKLRAGIDEFYIARVQKGQSGSTQPLSGSIYPLLVTRVYPEVREGRFEVDVDFSTEMPAEIRRGQTIRFDLALGDPATAIQIPRGAFYQSTGGNWIYVVDSDNAYATRRPIRIGRQNPLYYEVIEGLQPGEQVVTSSYETFGDADRLVFR